MQNRVCHLSASATPSFKVEWYGVADGDWPQP